MAVKQPQDRKPKEQKPKVTKTDEGWTVVHDGVTVHVPTDALNDFELLDDLSQLQADESRNAHRMPSLLRRLVGKDGYTAVTERYRAENGRVPIQEPVQFIADLFGALDPNS